MFLMVWQFGWAGSGWDRDFEHQQSEESAKL